MLLLCAPATWPASQTNWEEVHRSVGTLKSQLLPGGLEGVPWEPGSVAKGAGSKWFRLSMTSGDDLSSCFAWKVTELGPPDCVLLSTVSVLPGSAVTLDFPSTCKASMAMVPCEEGQTSRSSSGKLGHTALPMPAQVSGLVFPLSLQDQRVPFSEHI